MEIGGSDLIFENIKVELTDEIIIPIFKRYWPEAVYECFEETTDSGMSWHWFIYINDKAAEAWDEDFFEEYDSSMIYVIWKPKIKQVTFVIDSNKENKHIVEEVMKVLRSG